MAVNIKLNNISDIKIANATSLGSVPKINYETTDLPTGTYRFMLYLYTNDSAEKYVTNIELSAVEKWVYGYNYNYDYAMSIKSVSNNSNNWTTFLSSHLNNANSRSFKVKLCVSNDNFATGFYSNTRIINISIDKNNSAFKPTFPSSVTWKDINTVTTKVTSQTNNAVQGYSEIEFTRNGNATAKYGATIESYELRVGSISIKNNSSKITLNLADTGYDKIYGDQNIKLIIKDSRGLEYEHNVGKMTIYQYVQPKISLDESHRGDNVRSNFFYNLSGSWTCIRDKTEGGSQSLSIKVTLGITGATSQTLIASQTTGSSFKIENIQATLGDGKGYAEIDINESVPYTITITDGIGTYEYKSNVTLAVPVVSVRKKKVGINNPTPTCALDVIGGLKVVNATISGDAPLDLNNCTLGGLYNCVGGVDDAKSTYHFPINDSRGILLVLNDGTHITQMYFDTSSSNTYIRYSSSGAWKKITTTNV